MKSLVVSSPVMIFLYGTKYAIFVNQSTIINITSKFNEDGKLVMKSVETKDQGCFRIGSGCRSPYRRCRGFFDLEQCHKITQILLQPSTFGATKNLEK